MIFLWYFICWTTMLLWFEVVSPDTLAIFSTFIRCSCLRSILLKLQYYMDSSVDFDPAMTQARQKTCLPVWEMICDSPTFPEKPPWANVVSTKCVSGQWCWEMMVLRNSSYGVIFGHTEDVRGGCHMLYCFVHGLDWTQWRPFWRFLIRKLSGRPSKTAVKIRQVGFRYT